MLVWILVWLLSVEALVLAHFMWPTRPKTSVVVLFLGAITLVISCGFMWIIALSSLTKHPL
jgi:hypothetical protein